MGEEMKCCGEKMKELKIEIPNGTPLMYRQFGKSYPSIKISLSPKIYVCEVCGFVKGEKRNIKLPKPSIPNFNKCFTNEETQLPLPSPSFKDIPNIKKTKLVDLSYLKDDMMNEIDRLKKQMRDNNEK